MPSLETIIVRNMLPRPISPLLSIPQPTLLHNRQYYHSLRPQLSIPTQIQPRHRPLSNSHSRYSLNLSNIQPSSINHPVTNSPPFLLKNNQPTPNSPTLPQLINPRPSSHHPLFHNPNHHHKFSTTKQSNLSLSRHSKLLKM